MAESLLFDGTKTLEKEETIKTEVIEEIEISCSENYSENEIAVKLENEESDFIPAKTAKKTRRLPSILQKKQKRQKLSKSVHAIQAARTAQEYAENNLTGSAFTIGYKSVQNGNLGTQMVPILNKKVNTEPGQNRIILPKARIKSAIQGIAIGNKS